MRFVDTLKSLVSRTPPVDPAVHKAFDDMLAWRVWEMDSDMNLRLIAPPPNYRLLQDMLPNYVAYLERAECEGRYGRA